MSVTMLRKKAIMEGGEKMPAIHMSKKELIDLIDAGDKAGSDTSQLKNFLAELPSEKAARKPPPVAARRLEPERAAEELVTGPELERLRILACPHIKNSPYWEDYISRRVLACSDCQRAGLPLGEKVQPRLL